MSKTFFWKGVRAARSAAETPTGPAPITAKSNVLPDISCADVMGVAEAEMAVMGRTAVPSE